MQGVITHTTVCIHRQIYRLCTSIYQSLSSAFIEFFLIAEEANPDFLRMHYVLQPSQKSFPSMIALDLDIQICPLPETLRDNYISHTVLSGPLEICSIL
ncbi:MAG: hypothetical protein ED558_04975 [Oricola sp.]|nr:MAG: hypothetical protein ED558_04975 [Oricola sp.]